MDLASLAASFPKKGLGSKKKRYRKQGEIRSEKEKEEDSTKRRKTDEPKEDSIVVSKSKVDAPTVTPKPEETPTLDLKQTHALLRSHSLPVTLFGETPSQVQTRLQTYLFELKKNSGDSEFRQRLGGLFTSEESDRGRREYVVGGEELQHEEKEYVEPIKEEKKEEEVEKEEEDESTWDANKIIYYYFKRLLKSWEADLAKRPGSEAMTSKGKMEKITFNQCKDYIKPLFKQLRAGTLEEAMEKSIMKIVEFCKAGEFVQANDCYIDIAIGRAAWPIGVTMVGIHARAGREKLAENKVAHVMNSEMSRKYLTSVKRLMSFEQGRRGDVDPSKKVQF